jgi:hypothetical protein
MDEEADYADRELPPARPWVKHVLPVVAWLGLIGGLLVVGAVAFLNSLQRFD